MNRKSFHKSESLKKAVSEAALLPDVAIKLYKIYEVVDKLHKRFRNETKCHWNRNRAGQLLDKCSQIKDVLHQLHLGRGK
jgi:hypothetical protein